MLKVECGMVARGAMWNVECGMLSVEWLPLAMWNVKCGVLNVELLHSSF